MNHCLVTNVYCWRLLALIMCNGSSVEKHLILYHISIFLTCQMHMYVYIYIHMYVYKKKIYIYTYTYIYIHIYIHTIMHSTKKKTSECWLTLFLNLTSLKTQPRIHHVRITYPAESRPVPLWNSAWATAKPGRGISSIVMAPSLAFKVINGSYGFMTPDTKMIYHYKL